MVLPREGFALPLRWFSNHPMVFQPRADGFVAVFGWLALSRCPDVGSDRVPTRQRGSFAVRGALSRAKGSPLKGSLYPGVRLLTPPHFPPDPNHPPVIKVFFELPKSYPIPSQIQPNPTKSLPNPTQTNHNHNHYPQPNITTTNLTITTTNQIHNHSQQQTNHNHPQPSKQPSTTPTQNPQTTL